MSNFFTTENVKMFPSAYRRTDTKGKYNSEENFTNIVNSVVDNDKYVLSYDNSTHLLRVVLHGYYFEISDFDLSGANRNCWVAIRVEQGANALVDFDTSSVTPEQIDKNGNFTGLAVSTSQFNVIDTSDYKYYQLHVANNGELLNQIRFSSNSLYYKDNEDQNLSDLLDTKQANLTAGYGINSSELQNNKVQIIDSYKTSLDSIANTTVGSATTPIYISSGLATPLSASSGKVQTSASAGGINYQYTQAALITNGALQDTGVAFYASVDSPNQSVGKNGDFWFKYTNS